MTNKDSGSYIIRDAIGSDRNFIFATWLRGLYYGDSWFNKIPKPIFMENYHKVIERILDQSNVTIKVACLADDPDVILGYSIYRTANFGGIVVNTLDWVFVKSAWRKIGIGKKLLPDKIQAYTHITKLAGDIIKLKAPSLIFNPFLT